jgi:peroxiredoxin
MFDTKVPVLASVACLAFTLLSGCTSSTGPAAVGDHDPGPVALRAADVRPLDVGQKVPSAHVYTVEEEAVDIRGVVRRQPTVLIFYRGGWCPYCSAHLGELGGVEEELRRAGYQIIAVSPDRPEYLQSALKEKNYGYTLISDHEANASRAFGLAFQVGMETLEKYRDMDIDLAERSGARHHILPVPAAYVVDEDGVIRFAYWNPDYKQRIDVEELLRAARRARE